MKDFLKHLVDQYGDSFKLTFGDLLLQVGLISLQYLKNRIEEKKTVMPPPPPLPPLGTDDHFDPFGDRSR